MQRTGRSRYPLRVVIIFCAILSLLVLAAIGCESDSSPPTAPVVALPTAPATAPPAVAPTTATATPPSSGPASDATATDLVQAGRELFTGGGGCPACHTIDGVAQGVLGPDQSRIGALAAGRIPGYTAERYIRESIVEPCAYNVTPADEGVTQNFNCNLMVATMAGIQLSDFDVDALVAFLLEQK